MMIVSLRTGKPQLADQPKRIVGMTSYCIGSGMVNPTKTATRSTWRSLVLLYFEKSPPAMISSMCSVFAESEILDLINEECPSLPS